MLFRSATQSQDRSYWDEFFSKDSSSVATPKKNIVDPLLGKILDPLEKALNLKFENKNFIKRLTEELDLSGGELSSSTSYTVNPGKKMICPEKGEVKIVSKNDNCDQMVLIKHDLAEGVMYSKFCNVQTKLVKGQKLSSGTPVGIAKENASIEILDKRSQKLSLKDVLGKNKNSQKKYQVDPLLNLALKPLEKTLNLLPKPESVSGQDQSEPHKFIKWLKQDSVSKKDPIKEELKKFKKLL